MDKNLIKKAGLMIIFFGLGIGIDYLPTSDYHLQTLLADLGMILILLAFCMCLSIVCDMPAILSKGKTNDSEEKDTE